MADDEQLRGEAFMDELDRRIQALTPEDMTDNSEEDAAPAENFKIIDELAALEGRDEGTEPKDMSTQAETDSIFAIVKDCQPLGSVDLGVTVKIFRVVAEIDTPRNRYSDDIYLVHILEPVGLNALVPERGVMMEHRSFSFDSTDEVARGIKLKISVSPSHD